MEEIDARSGFSKSNSVFYSKRKPLPLPQNYSLDVTTFISSRAHHGEIAFIDAATGRHFTFPQLWRAVDAVATSLSDLGIRNMSSSLFPPTPSTFPSSASPSCPLALSSPPVTGPKIVTTLGNMTKKEPRPSQVRDRVYQDDTKTLLYSSGTTGPSKGVVSSQRNLMAMVRIVLGRFNMDKEDTFICTVPMFHIYGLVAFVTGPLASGSTIYIGAVQVRHGRYAFGDPEVPGDVPAAGASYTGGDDERCGCDQGQVRLELATFGCVRWGTTEQGGDRGLCGQVPKCQNSPGLRVDRIHRSRGIHGLTEGEPEVRYGGAFDTGHRGQSRRP